MEENLYPNILITHIKKIFHILESKFPLLKYSYTNSPQSYNLTELESVPEELVNPGTVKYKYPDGKIEYVEHDKPIQIVLKQFCQYLLYLENNEFEYDDNNKRLAKNIFVFYDFYSLYLKGEKNQKEFDLLLTPDNLRNYIAKLPNFKCRFYVSGDLPIFRSYYQFINIYKFLYFLSEYIKDHTIFTFANLINYNTELLIIYIFTVINFNMMNNSIIDDIIKFLLKNQDENENQVFSLILIIIGYFYDKSPKIFDDILIRSDTIFCFNFLFYSKFLRNIISWDFIKEGISLEDLNIFSLYFYERNKGNFQIKITFQTEKEINDSSSKSSIYLLNKIKCNSILLNIIFQRSKNDLFGYQEFDFISGLFENLRILFFHKINNANNPNKSIYVLPSSCDDLMKKPDTVRVKNYYSFEVKSHFDICKFLLTFPLKVLIGNEEIINFFVQNTKVYLKEFIYYIKEYGPRDQLSSFSIIFYSKYRFNSLPNVYTYYYFDIFFIKRVITCRTSFKFEDYINTDLNIIPCLNEILGIPIHILNEQCLTEVKEENDFKLQFFIKISVVKCDIDFRLLKILLKGENIQKMNQFKVKFVINDEEYKKMNNNIENFKSLISCIEFLRDLKNSGYVNMNLIVNLYIKLENLDLKIIIRNKLEDCIVVEFTNLSTSVAFYYFCMNVLKKYLYPRRIIQNIKHIMGSDRNNDDLLLESDFINYYNKSKLISIKYEDESDLSLFLEAINKKANFDCLTLEIFDFHEINIRRLIEDMDKSDKIERVIFFHCFDLYESIYIFERNISVLLNAKNPKHIVYNLFIEDPGNENSFNNLMECSKKVFKNDKYFELNYHNFKNDGILSYYKNPIFKIYQITNTQTQVYKFIPESKITSDFVPRIAKNFFYLLYVVYKNLLMSSINKKPILNTLLKYLRKESGMKFSFIEKN